MKSYPSISDDPGYEDWKEPAEWKKTDVFKGMKAWTYSEEQQADNKNPKDSWEALDKWHQAHPTAATVTNLKDTFCDTNIRTTPCFTWAEMWDIICVKDVDAASSKPAGTSAAASSSAGPSFLDPLSKRPDREHLSKSSSAAELNRVRDGSNTKSAICIAVSTDDTVWKRHLETNLGKRGVLFLIRLSHFEGEFPLGLGRRTFKETESEFSDGDVEIEWFERKNKKSDWGKMPSFRKVPRHHQQKSTEALSSFLPVVITTLTPHGSDEPKLAQNCLTAIRLLRPDKLEACSSCGKPEDTSSDDDESEESSDEEEESESGQSSSSSSEPDESEEDESDQSASDEVPAKQRRKR